MFRLVIQWVLSTVTFMILMRAVPGFFVQSLSASLLVAIGIGFANALMGFALNQMSFPLAIILVAILAFAADVGLIVLVSSYVDGFYVYNVDPALWASGVLTALMVVLRFTMKAE
ncbi:MAG: phage holin family protein [Terracidiphilus sp.]